MIENTIITPQILTSNDAPIIFNTERYRSKSASCCGWLSHNEGSPLYKILQGGLYEVDVNVSATSATAGIIAIALYRDGVLDTSTISSQTLAAAGDNTNLSIHTKIKVCCRDNESISIQSVPSILSGADGTTVTETEIPIILNGTLGIDRKV